LHSVDPKGVVLRTVPEYLAGVTQIESLEAVIRDAVRHGEANPIWSIHALTQELAQIARAHERAEILLGADGPGGLVGAGVRSYPDHHAREPALARVVGGGQRLQEALGDTVEILGPHRHLGADLHVHRVARDRVDAAGCHHPPAPRFAGRLEEIVGTHDVVGHQRVREIGLRGGICGQVDHDIGPLACLQACPRIAEIEFERFVVLAGIERSQPGAGAVEEAEELALASVAKERRADPARRPPHKDLQLLPVIHAISSARESAGRKRRMPHGLVCGHRNRVQWRALGAD
jgi:hypothetical protein